MLMSNNCYTFQRPNMHKCVVGDLRPEDGSMQVPRRFSRSCLWLPWVVTHLKIHAWLRYTFSLLNMDSKLFIMYHDSMLCRIRINIFYMTILPVSCPLGTNNAPCSNTGRCMTLYQQAINRKVERVCLEKVISWAQCFLCQSSWLDVNQLF